MITGRILKLRGWPEGKIIGSITKTARDAYLRERGVTLLGGGLDEAPQAYKPIQSIVAAQSDLIDIVGTFTPKIVRMADEAGDT